MVAGLLVRFFYGDKTFLIFSGFSGPQNRDTDPLCVDALFKKPGPQCKSNGSWFLLGIVLSALFQRYVPAEAMTLLFGGNEAFGVLMAATVGVPLYACGGGTIPLLQMWLADGMSMGSAARVYADRTFHQNHQPGRRKDRVGNQEGFSYILPL